MADAGVLAVLRQLGGAYVVEEIGRRGRTQTEHVSPGGALNTGPLAWLFSAIRPGWGAARL